MAFAPRGPRGALVSIPHASVMAHVPRPRLDKDGLCQDLLTEAEKAEVANGAMYLTGRMQTAEVKNGNGRRYSRRILEREVRNYMQLLKSVTFSHRV